MTICGYLLLHRLSVRARGHVDRSISSQTIDSLDGDLTAKMPSQCSTESCRLGRVALYAAGVLAGGVAIGYFLGRSNALRKVRCNTKIELTKDKVVDAVDVEDIKKVYCRCWKSNKFPLCDGSHVAHNKMTGDNVGPLIVESKKATNSQATEGKSKA